ncbi:MAG: hypothetical protein KatS3mg102_2821 [Planctomycetota bacterium]|nr:MAG: hypothetical protein KatS3mg102_2821 [Planctomycetota bacterium]
MSCRQVAPRDERGFSLLELVVAGAVLVVLLGLIGAVLAESAELSASRGVLMHAETAAQARLFDLRLELMETNPAHVSVLSFSDPLLAGGGPQAALAFSSARDPQGAFQMSNGRPVWQAVVVYCPYGDPNEGGQLRRYADYTPRSYPVSIVSVDATQIRLSDGTVLPRAGGTVLLGDVAGFGASVGPPAQAQLTVQVRYGRGTVSRTIRMESTGRNKN